MHNCLSLVLSVFGLSRIHSILPNHHLRRPCIALHAHVQVLLFTTKKTDNSTLNQGVSSHKKIPKEQSWILRQYYGNNIVLFLFCACNELFFVSIYLLSFPPPPNSPPRLGIKPILCTADGKRLYPRHSALVSLFTRFHYVSNLRV